MLFATPERRLVFDINDFDETLPGPWEWDVKRLAASLAIAGRDNGYSRKERRRICWRGGGDLPRGDAGLRRACGNLDVWYASIDVETSMQDVGASLTTKQRRKTEARPSTRPAPATPCRRWAS